MMTPEDVLASIRPLVITVDALGTVLDVCGGFGGFFGIDLSSLVGASVFNFVDPDDVDELALYFAESTEHTGDELALTLPFRVGLVGTDGMTQPVDIIPTGYQNASGTQGWVVVVVPIALATAVTRSLDAEMAGAPRQRVRSLLTEELLVENESYGSRWFLIDLDDLAAEAVTTSRPEDRPMARALASALAKGWEPWGALGPGDASAMRVADLDPTIVELATPRSWRRVVVAPVHADGRLVAAYVQFGRLPDTLALDELTANVRARIQRLVDVTALLIARWHDRDLLVAAATRDPLTGLANRDAFAAALENSEVPAAVLYIDLDRFKEINDQWGHQVGDAVLVEVGCRVSEVGGPDAVVARLGGDEFVVFLPGATSEQAHDVAERMIFAITQPMTDVGGPTEVTVSVGVAVVEEGGDAVDQADRAMLRAKREGRARVVVSDGRPRRASGLGD
jgi:diguanylate cyclase (GGDEF)-like protein